MKLDLSTKLLDLKDAPIKDGDVEVNLGEALAHVFLTPDTAEARGMSPDEKVRRFKIAVAITAGGEQDFKEAEIAEIKTLVGKAYTPLIVGRVYEIIAGAAEKTLAPNAKAD